MAEQDDLRRRFDYHRPTPDKSQVHEEVRTILLHAALKLNDLVPEGREKALMLTHLEDAMMWGNAGVARNPLPQPVTQHTLF
jgi:hypothetical protein